MHVIPMIMLQGTLCDTGIPRTFYGGKICSVDTLAKLSFPLLPKKFPKLKIPFMNVTVDLSLRAYSRACTHLIQKCSAWLGRMCSMYYL